MVGVLQEPFCYGDVWGVLQGLVCYGSVWAYLPTSPGSPDAERCFLFLVLGITARRPQRFRRMHGLQRTDPRIAPSPFLRPASLALLLPVVPPRPLLLSSLHAHTALHSNSDALRRPCLPDVVLGHDVQKVEGEAFLGACLRARGTGPRRQS